MNKKTISRTVTLMVILLLCTAIGTFYYVKLELHEKNEKTDLFALIPEDCEAILEIDNIYHLFQDLHYTAFSQSCNNLQVSDLIRLLGESFNHLDEQKAHGLSGQMVRLLISFHAPGSPADQVLYGYSEKEDTEFIRSLLKPAGVNNPYPKEVKYNGESIHIYPVNNEKFLACYFHEGFCALSFQKKLIEKVIDTYQKRSPSIQKDPFFSKLSTQERAVNNLYLYARSQPLSNWTEFNIRVHNSSIYMAGNCFASDSSYAHTMTEGKRVSLIKEESLPKKTALFYQLAVSDSTSILPSFRKEETTPLQGYTFYDFIEDYTKGEINSIKFEGNDTTRLHQVLMLPLSKQLTGAEREWGEVFHYPQLYKRINGGIYSIYSLQKEQILNTFISQSPESEEVPLCAALFNQQLLLSPKADDIICYIQRMTSPKEEERPFEKEMTDLSQEPNFTLITDMAQLLKSPEEYTGLIPPFFLKHKSFFRDFTFSLQLVKVLDNINANIILTYKGV